MPEGHSAKVVLDGDSEKLERAFTRSAQKAREFDAAVTKAEATSKKATLASNALAEAQKKSSLSIDAAIGRFDKASAAIGKVTTLLGAAGLVGVAIQAGQTIDALSQRALALSDVKNNLRISIDGARKSTKGLVDDFTLQKTAMAGLRYGVFQTSAQMAKHVQIATTLARTLGTDSNKAVEDFTLGIARQSRMILDNLGILVDVDTANKRYADSVHKTVKALTDEEKAIAFRNEAYRQAEKAIKGLKLEEDSWAASLQKTKVALTNVLDDVLELPKNIAELGSELKRSVGVSDEATQAYATLARVGLAAITLGGSEALGALKDLHAWMTETSSTLGSGGHGMFGSVQGVGTQMALAKFNAEDDAAGRNVTMALMDSAMVGTRALADWKKKHRKKGGKKPLSSEMIAAINDSRAAGAFDRGSADTRDIAAAMAASGGPGQIQRAGSDTRDLQATAQVLSMTQRRIELDRAAEEQRQNFFGIQQTDTAAELQRIEELRAANVAYYSEIRDGTTDTGEQLEAYEAIRQANHEAEMSRIAVERQAEEERLQTVLKGIDIGKQAATQMVTGVLSITDARRAATLAAKAQGKSDVEAAKAGKIAALEATAGQLQSLRNLAVVKAIEQTALGIGDLASFNYPGAALHFAAAATWGAVGVGAGAGARALQGRASSMQGDMSGGAGGASGGGRAIGPGSSKGPSVSTHGSDSPVPGSPGPMAPSVGGGSPSSGSHAVIVDLRGANFYGTGGKKEFARFLDEALVEGSDNRRQRRSVG